MDLAPSSLRAPYGSLQARDGQKICSVCRAQKPIAEFNIDRMRSDGLSPLCRTCGQAKLQAWRAANPEREKEIERRAYEKNKAAILKRSAHYRRRQVAKLVAQFKEGRPCTDCRQVFPPCVMDFDHRPGVIKCFDLKGQNMSRYALARVMEEIAKCDLVCSNCHRLRTWRRRRGEGER